MNIYKQICTLTQRFFKYREKSRQGGLRKAFPGTYGVDSKKATPKRPSTKATTVSPRKGFAQTALPHLFTVVRKSK